MSLWQKPIKTELHTHLMGMLSADEFIIMMKDFGIKCDYEELKKKIYLPDRSITHSNMEEMQDRYIKRGDCILLILDKLQKEGYSEDDSIRIVFSTLLNKSLAELVKQGVKYVEISYSNSHRINLMDVKESGIQTRFLLSTDRKSNVSSFKSSAKKLKNSLIERPELYKGFDIMGVEHEITDEEMNPALKGSYLVTKLQLIVEAIYGSQRENSVLRLHSGETRESINNTRNMLLCLKKAVDIVDLINFQIEYRIGHGIRFDEYDKKLIELLEIFRPIIELNPSSNKKLGNIDSFSDYRRVIDFYRTLDLPIVISTDGHGMYDTTMEEEVDHVLTDALKDDPDYLKYLISSEEIILRKRGL